MPKRILLIDDEDDLREVTALSLQTVAGWEVSSASSGRVGMEMARAEAPDAILLDVMMPDQDGPSTLLKLRRDEATAHIPVIFLTAKIQPKELERLRAIGSAGILSKPFDPLRLASQVSELLGW